MKKYRTTREFFLKLAWVWLIAMVLKRGTGNGKKKNGNKTELELTDRSRVQVRFCSHFSFFPILFPVFVPRFPFPVLVTSVNLSCMIVDICGFSDRSLLRFRQCGLIYFLADCFSVPLCESTGVTETRNPSWTKLYQQDLWYINRAWKNLFSC